MDIKEATYSMKSCEMMIGRLQGELYPNNAMMGAVNSEIEKFSENEKIIYNAKIRQLNKLVQYRDAIYNYAMDLLKGNTPSEKPELEIVTYTLPGGTEQEFDFSL